MTTQKLRDVLTPVEIMSGRSVVVWQHAYFRELTLLRAKLTDLRYDRHSHETYVISHVTKGHARVGMGRQTVDVPAHSTLVINPEEWHDGQSAGDEECEYWNFTPSVDLLRHVAQQKGIALLPEFPARPIVDPILRQKLLIALINSTSPDGLLAEASMLDALGALVSRIAKSPAGKNTDKYSTAMRARLKIYREFVEASFSERIELQRLAELAGVTRFQVIRDFNRGVGVTPSTFIRNRRVRAARLLIEAGTPLAEASLLVGFADQSHLSRAFSAAYGIPPGVYRRARVGDRPCS